MKRVSLLAALFLLFSAEAQAAVAWTHGVGTASTANSTAHTTAAFTVAANDLLVACASVSGVATSATMTVTDVESLGWTKINAAAYSASANSVWCYVANAFATASTTETVTFTSSTSGTGANITVERLSGMLRTGGNAVRQSAIVSNGAASGTPAPAFTAAALTANAVFGIAGNSTSPATMTPPSGFTEQDDIGYSTPTTGAETATSNSGFTGTTVTWGSTSGSVFGAIVVEFDSGPDPAPAVVHLTSSSVNNGGTTATYDIRLPQPSLSGNLLVVAFQYGGATTATVTDDQSQTWTCSAATAGGQQVRFCYKANSAAGVVKVHIALGASEGGVGAVLLEVDNVNTATPLDVSCGTNTATGTSAPCGSMTTTASGEWVFEYCAQDSAPTNQETFTAGSGFAMLTNDKYDSQATQAEVQSSAGAVNPTMTMSLGASKTCVGGAFKSASAGTAPTGMYVRAALHEALNPSNGYTPGSTTLNVPCAGNAYFISILNEPNITVTGTPSDSNSNAISSTGAAVATGTSGNLYAWKIGSGATCSSTMTFTYTASGSQVSGDTVVFYDIAGSGGYDKRGTATGTQTVAGTLTTASVTPANSSGITFWVLGVSSDTVPGVNTGTFNSNIPGTVSSPNDVDQNNGWGNFAYSSSAAQTFVANTSLGGTGYQTWASTADAFFAPSSGSAATISKRKKLDRLQN